MTNQQRDFIFLNLFDCFVVDLKSLFRKVKLAAEHVERRSKSGYASEDAWNETSIELVQAAEVRSQVEIRSQLIVDANCHVTSDLDKKIWNCWRSACMYLTLFSRTYLQVLIVFSGSLPRLYR